MTIDSKRKMRSDGVIGELQRDGNQVSDDSSETSEGRESIWRQFELKIHSFIGNVRN